MENLKEALKPRIKNLRESLYLLARNKLSSISLVVILLIIIVAIFSPWIVPHPEDIADETHIEVQFQSPSAKYWFGTDELGRDMFTRVVYAARVSLSTAVIGVAMSLLIGVPLGAIAGSVGGWVDNLLVRITDGFLAFPAMLLCIAIVAIAGPSLGNALIAVSISWWAGYARLVRSQAISIRERKFIEAAETIGTSRRKIVFKHIIPNLISPVIVQASMDMGGVIMTIASLSFLGLGAQAPTPEWGLMISVGRKYFPDSWWCCIFPGLAIFITVLCFNLLGDALREILDPKTRKK